MRDLVVGNKALLLRVPDLIDRLNRCLAPTDNEARGQLLAQEFDELSMLGGLSAGRRGTLRELVEFFNEPDRLAADQREHERIMEQDWDALRKEKERVEDRAAELDEREAELQKLENELDAREEELEEIRKALEAGDG